MYVLSFVLGILTVPTFGLEQPEKTIIPPTPNEGTIIQHQENLIYNTGCGGHLKDSVAAISYKSFAQISPNERCVWTIKAENATSYSLEVYHFGLPVVEGETGAIATCIPRFGSIHPGITNIQINSTGVVNLPSDCPILIITLYSGNMVQNLQGFIMIYKTNSTGSTLEDTTNTTHYVVAGGEGHIRHPPSVNEQYSSYDYSTFVFVPADNIYNSARKTSVSLIVDSLSTPYCYASLALYKFLPSSGWSINFPEDHYCNDAIYKRIISSEPILFHFYSEETATEFGRGFHLTYMYLPSC